MISLREKLDELNAKTGIEAGLAVRAGKKASVLRMLFLPPAVFLLEYLLKLNFFRGLDGLVNSALAAYFIFVKEVKIREANNP